MLSRLRQETQKYISFKITQGLGKKCKTTLKTLHHLSMHSGLYYLIKFKFTASFKSILFIVDHCILKNLSTNEIFKEKSLLKKKIVILKSWLIFAQVSGYNKTCFKLLPITKGITKGSVKNKAYNVALKACKILRRKAQKFQGVQWQLTCTTAAFVWQ